MLFIYTTTKIKFCSNQGRISILDRQPSNSARHFSSFSSSNLQALPLVTPSVSCSAGKAKHKIDIDIHSERSIRLARSAKMANIFSSNSTISSATAAHVASPASSLRDLTFFGSGQPLSYAGADGFGSKTQTLQRQSLSLLFLNQGLSSAELAKLRSSLRLLGLNITHVPARF